MQNYERVMKALAGSDQGEDRQLAADLVGYFTGRGRGGGKEEGARAGTGMIAGAAHGAVTAVTSYVLCMTKILNGESSAAPGIPKNLGGPNPLASAASFI